MRYNEITLLMTRWRNDAFVKPLNYPKENKILHRLLSSAQAMLEVDTGVVLRELRQQPETNEITCHGDNLPLIWYSGCKLGLQLRDSLPQRDLAIWTRKMVRWVGEGIRPWLGAIWRIIDNFVDYSLDKDMLQETFQIVIKKQQEEPAITAGTVYRQLEKEIGERKAYDYNYKYYINAIYAGLEEFRQPTFVTEAIEKVLDDRVTFCPNCHRQYQYHHIEDARCVSCGTELILGNCYVCHNCKKYVGDEFLYCPYCGKKINRYPDIPEYLDTIEFALCKFTFGPEKEPSDTAAIYVNGESFMKIIREEELPSAKKYGEEGRAGDYHWMPVWKLFDELTEVQDINSEDYYEPMILDCCCGCYGCWPLHVKITETEEGIVTWSGFFNPFTSDPEMTKELWDYSGMRTYRFDKEQYRSELLKLWKWMQQNSKSTDVETSESGAGVFP